MKLILAVLLLIAGFTATALAQSTYDRHVIFDNSLPKGGYEYSETYLVAPSELETYDSKIPVDDKHFVSPPNGLRLKYKSAPGGDWRTTVEITRRYARPFSFEGDSLTFWCNPDFEINSLNTPRVFLKDSSDNGTAASPLVIGDGKIPPHKWTLVKIPVTPSGYIYQGTDDPKFRLNRLISISLVQGLDDNVEHTIYIDDIKIRNGGSDDLTPPPAPQIDRIYGYERHFDISWHASEASDLLAYRIYRSWDGKDFEPVGTQQGTHTRYLDFVDGPGKKAMYRVTAIDIAGNESKPSEPTPFASTHAFSDDELMTMAQEGCFRYYWETAHPTAGLAPEVLPGDPNLLAMGGNGFGVMALIVGAERGFAPRAEIAARIQKIVHFLSRADRFHGVWPHFLSGDTGRVIPFFGRYDNGGDLVETAFMMQGLLAARQYFKRDDPVEKDIRSTITRLWEEIEWDWYAKTKDSGQLYWHWSPDSGFHINHPLIGWNEAQIVYILAIASPTHSVPASYYYSGWAGENDYHIAYRRGWSRTTTGDHYANGNSFYGIKLDVGEGAGSDLFFTQFSYMGFDPRGMRDRYTNYFENNRNIVRINHAYCVDNPRKFIGYSNDCWGLSAGINSGGGKPYPRDDNGTICCMAALGSMPYTPKESLAALKYFYRELGPRVFGIYGFHDGFNGTQNWFEEVYMALNQAPITVMIENARTGLIWKQFMANPEIKPALEAIGFKPDSSPAAESASPQGTTLPANSPK